MEKIREGKPLNVRWRRALERREKLSRKSTAIKEEIETHGTAVDRECLHYVLNEKAGSSRKTFQHGWRRDVGRKGEVLVDFINHSSSRAAGLSRGRRLAENGVLTGVLT